MSKTQNVAAIDIGTSKIVAIVGNKDELGKIKVLGYGEAPSKGVARGTVQDVADVTSAIKEAVRKCQDMSGLQLKQVFVGISGQNIRTALTSHTKFIANNVISQDDVDQLTNEVYGLNKEQGEEIIHVIPQQYSVDNGTVGLSPVGFTGSKLHGSFYVVFGNATSNRIIKQAVVNANLNIMKLIYQPIASAEALLSQEDKANGVLVADIGAGATNVAIFKNKVLRASSSIPLGGNAITNDIKSACSSIIWKQAEALKREHASALAQSSDGKKIISIKGIGGRSSSEISVLDLSYITNARMDEILAGVAHVMQQSGYADGIEDVVLTGGGSKLTNINQLVKYRLGRAVRISKPRDLSGESKMPDGEEYSAIMGLLAKGIEYVESFLEKQSSKPQKKEGGDASGSQKKGDNPDANANDKKESEGFFQKLKKLANRIFEDPEDHTV
ncbi:MAG: cell division protein FtsA [Bacteroidales bacterium]|nr:cell division protein FtsA [Bacteroidales bacterium]